MKILNRYWSDAVKWDGRSEIAMLLKLFTNFTHSDRVSQPKISEYVYITEFDLSSNMKWQILLHPAAFVAAADNWDTILRILRANNCTALASRFAGNAKRRPLCEWDVPNAHTMLRFLSAFVKMECAHWLYCWIYAEIFVNACKQSEPISYCIYLKFNLIDIDGLDKQVSSNPSDANEFKYQQCTMNTFGVFRNRRIFLDQKCIILIEI